MRYEGEMKCANCKERLPDGGSESQTYSPERSFTLCESCWLAEDDEIEREGTNELPQRIARYSGQ